MLVKLKMNINILVDGSYLCFFRYYALKRWWSFSKSSDPLTDSPCENELFVEKYIDLLKKNIKDIEKTCIDMEIKRTTWGDPYSKEKVPRTKRKEVNVTVYIAKDCPQNDIWRMALLPMYKGTRSTETCNDISKFFELAYKHVFVENVLSCDHLEADDCVALFVKRQNKKEKMFHYVITSDADYMQLKKYKNVHIMDTHYKDITKRKDAYEDPECNLFSKIVIGDKSDNIPPIMNKLGKKTALRYFDHPEDFDVLLQEKPLVAKQYQLNKLLIDFESIPTNLQNDFYSKYEQLFVE